MRRFKSLFASKRDKGSDLSSSSSSSHSDHILAPSWKSWIGAKRSSQKPPLVVVHHDIDEDTQSEEEEDDDDGQHSLRIHIQNALAALPHANPPFVHDPHQPIFPRSSNTTSILSPRSSTRSSMFHSHLLARLNSAALSPSELSGILPFARKSAPSPIIHPILPSSDISRPKNASHISSTSLGIQRWITRPCFENRFAVYLPTDSGIQCHPVTSTMAIAALEYPEYLDVMVDPDFDQFSPNPETNVFNSCHHAPPADPLHTLPIQSHASPEPIPTPVTSVHWRNSSSATAVPSPLRIQHTPSPPSVKTDMSAIIPSSTVKRVVRFVEDDEDDGVPLHMVRMKKKREEKVKFLRLEQLKRAKEEDEAQRLQEQEALERERRRLAKEKEKKELDKALYADAIVAARMRREGHRAGTILPSNTTNPLTQSPSVTSLRYSERNKPLTDSRRLSSKPPFDSPPTLSIPRRDLDSPYYHHHTDSSPGSSRSPSINHSPVSLSYPSRPPSTYSAHTSSSEDVRHQRSTKRDSVTATGVATTNSGPSSYHRPPMGSSYPTWSGSSQTLPQVPPMPDFVHDMPLLPPTAPFMMSNRKSKSPGSSSSSRRGSINSSNERVNQLLPSTRTASASSRHHSSSPVPLSSYSTPEKRSTQGRRFSGDSTTLSLHSTQEQQRPTPTTSWSQPTLSRGRPALPSSSQYLQAPSSWPVLPSQNGLMPMPMGYPVNAYPMLMYPTGPPMQRMQMGSGGGGNSNGWDEPVIS